MPEEYPLSKLLEKLKVEDDPYPDNYIWALDEGYGIRGIVFQKEDITRSYFINQVPKEFRHLPVVKNIDYYQLPEWCNVIHTENTGKPYKRQQ